MKRFLILLLCAALIAGVCGCKAKDGEPETTSAPEATQEAAATEELTPSPAATEAPSETEAPEDTRPVVSREFLFCNGLGMPVTFELNEEMTSSSFAGMGRTNMFSASPPSVTEARKNM